MSAFGGKADMAQKYCFCVGSCGDQHGSVAATIFFKTCNGNLPNGLLRFPFPRMHIEDTRTSDDLGRVFPAEVEQGTFSSRTLDNADDE
jgi:hypothetical protein